MLVWDQSWVWNQLVLGPEDLLGPAWWLLLLMGWGVEWTESVEIFQYCSTKLRHFLTYLVKVAFWNFMRLYSLVASDFIWAKFGSWSDIAKCCHVFKTSVVKRESSTTWIVCVCVRACLRHFFEKFRAVYLTQFLTDFSQILDSKSYDQEKQTLWYHTTPRP